MIKKIQSYIRQYQMIEPGDTVIAGVSGGADSVCLLFVLLKIREQLPFTLKVVHVNHGIREDASEDARFVKELCARLEVPFELVEAHVKESAKENGLSEEEEGRRIRYQAFERALSGQRGKIAVAHNSNDRAETMLFHLFRGTGLAGVTGIPPVSGKVIRPLLCVKRSEIEEWLAEKDICFCTDSTNEQDFYTRNRIRHHILTYAEEQICHGAVNNMNRTAEQLLEAQGYLSRQTKAAEERCLDRIKDGTVTVHIPALLKEDPYLRGCILLSGVEQAAGRKKDITAAHIRSILTLFAGTGNGEVHLPYGLAVYKNYDLGMIQKKEKHKNVADCGEAFPFEIEVEIPSVIFVPDLGKVEFTVFSREYSQNIPEKTYTKWFDYDKISSSVMLRTRRQGDYLTVNDRMGRKSLQDYFVNEKIPREERSRLYVLVENSHVIWIPGYRMSEYYKIDGNTRRILQVKIMDETEDLRKES